MPPNISAKVSIEGLDQSAKGMRDLGTETKTTGEELDDTRTKAQKLADAMSAAADQIADDLEGARKAGEALADELGPEMAAKLGQSGLDEMVKDLNKAGLSFEEIEADADALAASVKKLDSATSSVDTLGTKAHTVAGNVDEVSDSMGKAQGATHSFVGNAVTELPGVGDAFGPLGQAVEGMTESVLGGEIAIKSMLSAAVPILALTVAIKGITQAFADNAKTKAFNKEQVEAYTDALRETDTVLDGIVESLKETNKIEFRLFDKTIDLVPKMAELNLTVEEFGKMVEGGHDAIREWGDDMKDAGANADDVDLIMAGAEAQAKNFAAGLKVAADETKVFGKETEEATEETDDFTKSLEKLTGNEDRGGKAAGRLAGDVGEVTEAVDIAEKAVYDLSGALDVLIGTGRDMEQASQDWERGVDDLTDSFAANGATLDKTTEQGRANRDMVKSQTDLILTEYIPALIESGESADSAAEQGLTLRDSLIGQMEQLGLTTEEAEAYVNQLGLTPENINTVAHLDTSQAKIALADLMSDFDELANKAAILAAIGGKTGTGGTGTGGAGSHIKKAAGGRVHAGVPLTVGESGPEPFLPDEDGRIVSNSEFTRMIREATGGGGGSGMTVINYWPVGVSAVDAQRALERYRKWNGGTR